MGHLDDGVLRRMMDEPLAMRDSDRRHFDVCSGCRDRFDAIEADARWARDLLTATASNVDAAAALAGVQRRIEVENNPRLKLLGRSIVPTQQWVSGSGRSVSRRGTVRTSLAGVLAAAVMVGALALTPAGSLAQQIITIFQPTQLVAVPINTGDVQTLQQLSKFGTFSAPSNLKPTAASSAQDASAQSGMTVLVPATVPAGVSLKPAGRPGNPSYQVLPSQSGSFTFSAAQATVASGGKSLPTMPAGMDGSTLQVATGTAVIATYRTPNSDIPALLIGQTKTPIITATGVTVQQMENYLLSLPGVSPELAAQIRAMGDLTTALPVPVLVNRTYAHPVTVQGVQGLAVGDSTGAGAGVVWQKDGFIYGVGGPMTESQALQIANSLA